jgi:hypothetical protein
MRGCRHADGPKALAETRSNADLHGVWRIWYMSAVPRQGDPTSVDVRRRPQQVSRRNCLSISTIRCLYTMIVGAWPLGPASLHHGDPTAVGIGDVVEVKKVPWTPTNQCAPTLVGLGPDFDIARRESCGNAEKFVAGSLGLETGGSPRDERVQRGKR